MLALGLLGAACGGEDAARAPRTTTPTSGTVSPPRLPSGSAPGTGVTTPGGPSSPGSPAMGTMRPGLIAPAAEDAGPPAAPPAR